MDDYVEKVNNHPKVDDYLLTIFIHFWIVTIPVCYACTLCTVGAKKSLAADATSVVKSPHRVKLEPVGVFWDIENCPVPVDKSAFSLAAKMRRVFFEGKREAEFMCVCDVTKERKEVTDALHKAQVHVTPHYMYMYMSCVYL